MSDNKIIRPPHISEVTVKFDNDTSKVSHIHAPDFHSFQMIKAALLMAADEMQFQIEMQRAQALQQQAVQEQLRQQKAVQEKARLDAIKLG